MDLPRIVDIIRQCGLEGEDADLFRRLALNRLAYFTNATLAEWAGQEGEGMDARYSLEEVQLDEECDNLHLTPCSRQVLKALETYLRAFLPEETLARMDQ